MRKVQQAKYLFIGVSCAAVLAGCYHPDRSTRSSHYQSSYSQGSGLTSSDNAYSSSQAQGATGAQTDQTTGTGEIQSERVVIPLHEEQVQVGKRTVETGQVRLRKQITTETINQPVEIRKETIVVDREPASGTTTSTSQSYQSNSRGQQFQQGQSSQLQSQASSISQPFEQGEIVVRLHSEEPVIEKRTVPAGNIVVETRVNNEQVNVQQQVRREKIDVDKGNAQNVIVSEKLNQSAGTRESAGSPPPEPQRYQQQSTRGTSTTTRSPDVDTEYRAPVTTREYEGFRRPQPDGRDTFQDLKKDPERNR
ncbi:MAG TPA: YsnF/AvaK domain-containing protein [Verrucomicrobiae bacterium]|nr:YsnF/AvaK domain-containing protein [Verrucomicrobiae bacterium]